MLEGIKVFSRRSLQDEIKYNGEIYRPNMGMSGKAYNDTTARREVNQARAAGRKAIVVKVLQTVLRGRNSFHNKPYEPTIWIYTNKI